MAEKRQECKQRDCKVQAYGKDETETIRRRQDDGALVFGNTHSPRLPDRYGDFMEILKKMIFLRKKTPEKYHPSQAS
jgi:hypothetical protein